jgi:hypothetical protein
MNANEKKQAQLALLEKVCIDKEIDFESIKRLLDSVKTKKLYKRNNYHQSKISDEIDNAVKNEI